jgi:hypothetical protein
MADDVRTIIDRNDDWKLCVSSKRVYAVTADCRRVIRLYTTDKQFRTSGVEENLPIPTVIQRYVKLSGTNINENTLYDEVMAEIHDQRVQK